MPTTKHNITFTVDLQEAKDIIEDHYGGEVTGNPLSPPPELTVTVQFTKDGSLYIGKAIKQALKQAGFGVIPPP